MLLIDDVTLAKTKLVVIVGDELPSIQTAARGLPAHPPYGVVEVAPQIEELLGRVSGANALPVSEVTSSIQSVVPLHVEVTVHRSTINVGPLPASSVRDRMLRSVAEH